MPESGTTVSVIIPTYNSSGTLKLTLQTIIQQDFADFEAWIIGDGCTDDSDRIVASFEDDRLHWVNLSSNSGGPSLPRDEGLRRAAGQFIAYLGHDDLWFPWHLSELVDCIETSGSDFVYSLGANVGREGVFRTFSLAQRAWSRTEFISPSNWMHRRGLDEVVGPWSTGKKYGDDQEFLRRVLAVNAKLEFRRRLSVLKFPAEVWSMYSIASDFPQTRYVERMFQDAMRLHDELLLEFATNMSLARVDRTPFFRKMLRRGIFHLLNLYGWDRWPVDTLLYHRWRRMIGLKE
jgi:glycosyltransferase involved in cell wall biosynthesis